MNLDIQEILTFSECPMKHYFKYIEQDNRYNIDDKYLQDILGIVYTLFNMIQDGNVSIKPLKAIWGRKWINKKSKDEFIYEIPKSWRDSYGAYKKKGIQSIVFLFEEFSGAGYRPLIINQPYSFKLSNDLTITGKFHIVAEKDDKIELMLFRSFKLIDRLYLKNDYEATMLSLVFRQKFKQEESHVSLNCFERKKIINEVKTNDQIKTVIKDIHKIHTAIKNELYYRSVNESCYYCPYKNECVNTFDIDSEKVQNYIVEKSFSN